MTNLLTQETLSIDMGEEIKESKGYTVYANVDTKSFRQACKRLGRAINKMRVKEQQVRVS